MKKHSYLWWNSVKPITSYWKDDLNPLKPCKTSQNRVEPVYYLGETQ